MSHGDDSGTLNVSDHDNYLYALRDDRTADHRRLSTYEDDDNDSESPSSPFITNPELGSSRTQIADTSHFEVSKILDEDPEEQHELTSDPEFEDASEVVANVSELSDENPNDSGHLHSIQEYQPNTTIEEMDASIASLRESLANLRATGDQPDDTFHNSTIDTTRYNDTQAQLDNDITFEKPIPKIARTKPGNRSSTWGKLRTSYHSAAEPALSFHPSHSTKASITSKSSFQPQDASGASKVDDLNKQITGYRIQIKFFKQFLQNLIDKSRYGTDKENGLLDLNELTKFQANFNGLSQFKSEETTKLENDYNALLKNYDEIFKLNEDLYENLEAFQNQLQAKESQIHQQNEYIEACTTIVNDILQVLISNPKTDVRTREALARCMDTSNSSRPLEMKLQVISFEFGELLTSPVKPVHPTPPSSGITERDHEEFVNYIGIIKELIGSIDKLEKEFNEQKAETSRLEKDLKTEIEESNQIRTNYKVISQKFKSLCDSLESGETGVPTVEIERLRAENSKLNAINNVVDAKFEEYQKVIDRLQLEVNEFKEFSRKRGNVSGISSRIDDTRGEEEELRAEVLESHKALTNLHEELSDISDKYRKLKEDSSKTISALTNQLHNGQQEIAQFRADERVAEKSRKDLDIAVEKQRVYKAENIRLSYKVDALTNDKQSLQATIGSLTDKVTSLTVGDTSANSSETLKQLSVLEFQFKELLALDVFEFQKFLKSFNKIADDNSVKDPTLKIDKLIKRLGRDDAKTWDRDDINSMRELHRSIFDYFARAVEMIVNDHVKLLLKESEGDHQSDEYVEKLHKRIDELNMINDSLVKQQESPDHTDTTEIESSPTTKLRMDELWNRWKAEREARVYESKQADRRLKELELENSRLRAELAKGD